MLVSPSLPLSFLHTTLLYCKSFIYSNISNSSSQNILTFTSLANKKTSILQCDIVSSFTIWQNYYGHQWQCLKCIGNQLCHVLSVFYYQQFHKALQMNKTAVFLNYQHIKIYLQSTKECQTELLSFSFLLVRKEGENFNRFTLEMQLKELEIPSHTEHTFEGITYCQVQHNR